MKLKRKPRQKLMTCPDQLRNILLLPALNQNGDPFQKRERPPRLFQGKHIDIVQSQRFAKGKQIHPFELHDLLAVKMRKNRFKTVRVLRRNDYDVPGAKTVLASVAKIVEASLLDECDDHVAAELFTENKTFVSPGVFVRKRINGKGVQSGKTPMHQHSDIPVLEISRMLTDIPLYLFPHDDCNPYCFV